MEFRFSLAPLFPNPIIKVNSNLLPSNFRGDRRTALETTTKMAEIINIMGELSAKAQGLTKPVTTAQKLRQSDQNLYLLADTEAGKNGAALGLLKVGKKTLYVFDENGETQTVNAPCVLDFYIHESRQRAGLGKTLFQTMLKEENFVPKKLAIDRPSDKLLGFLKKHYGLDKSIPQMNNFVIFDGFFDTSNNNDQSQSNNVHIEITASSTKPTTTGPCYYSPNTALFGPQFGSEEYRRKRQQNAASIPTIQNSPVGRYAAPRPACSMAEQTLSRQMPQQFEQFVPVAQNSVQYVSSPMFHNAPQCLPSYHSPQNCSQQMNQVFVPQYPNQIVTQQIPQYISKENLQNATQSFSPQPVMNSQDYNQFQMVNSNLQQTNNFNEMNNLQEKKDEDNKNTTCRRFKANGLSEDPQHINHITPTQTQNVRPAGKPSETSNSNYYQSYRTMASPVSKNVNPDNYQIAASSNESSIKFPDSNETKNNPSKSLRKPKADGLSEDPQRIIHTIKEVVKMKPAGKPSGMKYSDINISGSKVTSQVEHIQENNPPKNIHGNETIGNSNNSQIPARQFVNIPPVANNSVPIMNSIPTMTPYQIPTPQMITTQMTNPPNTIISSQPTTQTPIISSASVGQAMSPQIVPNTQIFANPQILQTSVTPQMSNSQVSIHSAQIPMSVVQTPSNIQQVPPSQQVETSQILNASQTMTQTQIENTQAINSQQAMNPSLVNETQNFLTPNHQGNLCTAAQNMNPQVPINTHIGDGFNQVVHPQGHIPQTLNVVNPSEPFQTQIISGNQKIIHNKATSVTEEPKSNSNPDVNESNTNIDIDDLSINIEHINVEDKPDEESANDIIEEEQPEQKNNVEDEQHTNGHANEDESKNMDDIPDADVESQIISQHMHKPQHIPVNKMHTGLKNISFNVSMAVTPTNKMDFGDHHDNTDAQSTVSSVGSGGDGYTDQGHLDLKFYHNKLW